MLSSWLCITTVTALLSEIGGSGLSEKNMGRPKRSPRRLFVKFAATRAAPLITIPKIAPGPIDETATACAGSVTGRSYIDDLPAQPIGQHFVHMSLAAVMAAKLACRRSRLN